MSDLISRQAAISPICNACGKIDCDKMDKCEKLQLPPANCSEFPNNSDTISRQAAIDELKECRKIYCDNTPESFSLLGHSDKSRVDEIDNAIAILVNLPSAHPQRWIPCSERLPEVGTYVLVSKKSLGFRSNLPNVCTAHRSRDPRSGKEE